MRWSTTMEHEGSETMAAEAIEWPFLKAQRDGGDPEVSAAAASDGDSTRPSSEGNNGNHYEIIVNNPDVSTAFSSAADGAASQFETCLISNADLAALASANGVDPTSVKIEESLDGRTFQYASAVPDSVHYIDPESALAGVAPDSEEHQRLIKVYQTAIENSDNKLITVYEIKQEEDGSVGATGLHGIDTPVSSSDGDVMVEIVHSAEDEQLLRSVTDDSSLTLSSASTSFQQVLPQSFVTAPTTVAELRCTLCGFVSFARDEIAEHCMAAHDLFLCQTCNLVFKRRHSLQAHARAKHGHLSAPALPAPPTVPATRNLNVIGVGSPVGSRPSLAASSGRIIKRKAGPSSRAAAAATKLATTVGLPSTTIEMMPDIKDILAKNKAVLPVLTSAPPTVVTTVPHINHFSTAAASMPSSASSGKRPAAKKAGGSGGKRSSAHDWARVGSLTAQQQQQLMMDSRLSDPQTRHQFNIEFAKKITSHGIGAEVLGLSEERLPARKGTFRLDIRERVLENGESVPVDPMKGDSSSSGANGDNVDVFYSYDIVDTKIPAPDGGCNVICGMCNFSNPRIENVLFHCEIDHKQYYCQNKQCQNGFSSWDSLMRHMKTVHKKDK